MIRDVEPAKPSSRLRATAAEERTRIAKARQIPPSKVNSLVEPDLDWIVMKGIDKDRARRYQTANGLAQDIGRFLADKTVSARPPTAAYQFRKFARRHKVALRVGAGIVTVLLAGTVVSMWQAVRATRAEQRAREQSRLADTQRMRADDAAEAAQQNLYDAQMHLGLPTWREHRGLKYLREILGKWLPVAASPDRRGRERYYLAALPHQNVRSFTSAAINGGRTSVVAWHIGSGRLAEGTADGVIRVWDADRYTRRSETPPATLIAVSKVRPFANLAAACSRPAMSNTASC